MQGVLLGRKRCSGDRIVSFTSKMGNLCSGEAGEARKSKERFGATLADAIKVSESTEMLRKHLMQAWMAMNANHFVALGLILPQKLSLHLCIGGSPRLTGDCDRNRCSQAML